MRPGLPGRGCVERALHEGEYRAVEVREHAERPGRNRAFRDAHRATELLRLRGGRLYVVHAEVGDPAGGHVRRELLAHRKESADRPAVELPAAVDGGAVLLDRLQHPAEDLAVEAAR